MLVMAMAYVPSIFNSATALFTPCILVCYVIEIQYHFGDIDITLISPSRNPLSNIIEESAAGSILDLQCKLGIGARVFIANDHSNKNRLHCLVKVLSMWNTIDNSVKQKN